MRTFVTGAQGFLGSWLVSRLLDRGDEVAVLERAARPGSRFEREDLGARVSALPGDLDDATSLARAVEGAGVVFHLAARTIVAEAERDPAGTFDTNVGGTWRLLDACAAAGVPRVVLVSSYLAYGRQDGGLYREDMPLRPGSVYGAATAAADMVARAFGNVGIVRLSNVYGGGDVHRSRLVPEVVHALAEGRRPVLRTDGTPRRDFLYVEDAVEACLAVAGSPRAGAWHAGAGEAVSVLELVRAMTRAAGREDLEPDVQGAPTGGPPDVQLLDCTAIREELGWQPRHALEEGLARTWAWHTAEVPA